MFLRRIFRIQERALTPDTSNGIVHSLMMSHSADSLPEDADEGRAEGNLSSSEGTQPDPSGNLEKICGSALPVVTVYLSFIVPGCAVLSAVYTLRFVNAI